MYKAILCDDDEIIAQGLSALIPWNTLDICLCGTYNDGLAAKKALDREAIDIVISDIRMPFLDGLELTRLAKEQRPETKIILISGYDDFRYAREALKLGASDYLLKPINEEELIALLKRTVEQLQVQKQQESILSYGETSKRVDMLRCLAYEGNSSFVNRFGEAALGELEGRQCVAVVSLIDEYENFAQRYNRDEIQDIDQDFRRCVENPEFPLTVIEKFGGNIVSILQASSVAGVLHARQQYCDRLHAAFRTLYPALSVTIAASAAHPCAELQTAFTEMSQAIKERFVRPAGSDIFYESIDLNVNAQKNSLDNVAIVNAIISAIRLGDRVECEREIALLQQKLSLIGAESIMLMRLLVGNIFLSVIKDLQQYGINLREMGIDVPVYGMVKDDKHRTRAITEDGGEIAIQSTRAVFTLVSSIQDEVHRFAIGYHRQQRKKATISTTLTSIPGIGETRAKALMKHFTTIRAVSEATEEMLEETPGMNAPAARAVYRYFHSEENDGE